MSGRWFHSGLCAAVTVLLAGCGGGSGSSQTGSSNAVNFLTVSLNQVGAVTSNLDSPTISTTICAGFQNNPKNPTLTAPTSLDDIRITSYTVTYTRFDGGTPPGPFTFNTALIVPAGQAGGMGQAPVVNNTANALVVILPAGSKRQPPLSNPRPLLPLNTTATLSFRGEDNRGQRHEASAAVTVVFLADTVAEVVPACAA